MQHDRSGHFLCQASDYELAALLFYLFADANDIASMIGSVRDAGEGLCNLLRDEGRADTAQALCQEVSTRAPGAIWAWRRLAFFSLDGGDYEKAVLCFQTALRGDVKHAGAWEGLGSAFQSLARLTAALKVCLLHSTRCQSVPSPPHCCPQGSAICTQLSAYWSLVKICNVHSNSVPISFWRALCGLAVCLLHLNPLPAVPGTLHCCFLILLPVNAKNMLTCKHCYNNFCVCLSRLVTLKHC